MPHHLIVTCGTSQIEQRRLDRAMQVALVGKPVPEQEQWKKVRDFAAKMPEPPEGVNDDYIRQIIRQQRDEGKYCETLLGGLVAYWERISQDIGKDTNPFGAEISTLYKMATASPPLFVPTTDSIVLLYSDTPAGAFCAAVLYRLLTHQQVYNMPDSPDSNITYQRIPELREQPRNVAKAEDNTRAKLLEARQGQGERTNVFVMTGGFKSTLPILTVIALVYGEPIYYLFERSEDLRRVDPQATVQSAQRWWQFLASQRTEQQDATSVTVTIKTGSGTAPAPASRLMP